MTDASLGGYFEKHSRPPAFEGSDGASYSVDVYIEENSAAEKQFAAAKWMRFTHVLGSDVTDRLGGKAMLTEDG